MKELTFQMDRYNSTNLLSKWKTRDKSKALIDIDDIEIDFDENSDKLLLEEFFLHINEIDNKIQKFCKTAYENGKFDIRNYIVSLAWITLKDNIITLGYWGDYVNIELRAFCKLENQKLIITDVYYQ